MSDLLREQANDEREAREADATAYQDVLRLEAENATVLSALKAMDEALTWHCPSGPEAAKRKEILSHQQCEAWIQIRSAISQANRG